MSKLETDSDSSEEFFDAEDTTPNRHATLGWVLGGMCNWNLLKNILHSRKLPPEVAQEFIFPDPAVRVNAAASSDSDATPIGAGTPATRSPTNSLGARLKQQDVAGAAAGVFAEPKPVLGSVSGRVVDLHLLGLRPMPRSIA